MPNQTRRNRSFDTRDNFQGFDDFTHFVTGDLWTSLVADATTSIAVGDTANGVVALTTGATDNNEADWRTTAELFLMGAGEPMFAAASLQFAEANTDDANVMFGFMSALAANSLVDNGAGVRTTGSYAVIYKVDGETAWRCRSRNGTETTDNATAVTAGSAAGVFHELEIEIVEYSTLSCEILYKRNGIYFRDSATNEVISHRLLYASATEMNLGAYVKAGGANSEVLSCDWVGWGKVR